MHSPYVLYAIAAYERAFKLLEETLAESGPWLVALDRRSPTSISCRFWHGSTISDCSIYGSRSGLSSAGGGRWRANAELQARAE